MAEIVTESYIESREEARNMFREYLRSQSLKSTRQRDQILEIFLDSDEHLTAEDLYQNVIKQNPKIGFSTVYRTLHVIVACGIAREREFSAGKKYYEHIVGEKHHHHHLICTKCNRIIEFMCPQVVEQSQVDIANEYGFTLTGHTHELFGLCPDCST